ncbi:hypothetical protein WT01_25420 [Burkholderia cepacia]|nr:hypothetical protein WT01_25420 [Burkholderia cepacia]
MGRQEDFLKRAALDNERVSTERGKNTINKIMAGAIEICVVEGYGGLTLRKVAAKAGLAVSNLQHCFPTREDIFEAILSATREAYANTYDGVLTDTSLTPEGRLEKVVRLLPEDGKRCTPRLVEARRYHVPTPAMRFDVPYMDSSNRSTSSRAHRR